MQSGTDRPVAELNWIESGIFSAKRWLWWAKERAGTYIKECPAHELEVEIRDRLIVVIYEPIAVVNNNRLPILEHK